MADHRAPGQVAVATPSPLPTPPPLFDAAREPDLVLRPRWWLVALAVAAMAAGVVALAKLSYDTESLDPRVPLLAAYSAVIAVVMVRARIAVTSGVMTRRTWRRWSAVSLDELRSVEIRRARLLKQEGPIRNVAVVEDRWGRRIKLKPVLWSGGARALLAMLDARVRALDTPVDDRTRTTLTRAGAAWSGALPGWASARPLPWETWPSGDGTPVPPDSATAQGKPSTVAITRLLWQRRKGDGRPKLKPGQLVAVLAAMGVGLGAIVFVGNAGTKAIRAEHCAAARHLWGTAAEVPQTEAPVSLVYARIGVAASPGTEG